MPYRVGQTYYEATPKENRQFDKCEISAEDFFGGIPVHLHKRFYREHWDFTVRVISVATRKYRARRRRK